MNSLLDPNVSARQWMLDLLGSMLTWRPDLTSPNAPLIGLLIASGLVWIVARHKPKEPANQAKKKVKMPSTGRWHFAWRHEHSVKIGSFLNSIRFDIAWRHIGICGTSGSKKSTLMAMLIEKIGKVAGIVTADESPPLLNYTLSVGGTVWRPRGHISWYPWGGPLEHAVQRVEHMFPASGADAGVHRSMFKQCARRAWGYIPENARTVQQVIEELKKAGTGASSKNMVENWSTRLQELVDSLGTSLATGSDGGFDLCEKLTQGETVMFSLNSFTDISNRERFAKIAVLEMLRAADTVGGLTMGIDEVGLLGAELFAESVRTLRVRKCTGIFASHIANDFPDILRGLIAIWFLGQVPGGDKKTREWCSHTTFGVIPPEHFGDHALPLGSFFAIAGGRIRKVKIPTWKMRRQWSYDSNVDGTDRIDTAVYSDDEAVYERDAPPEDPSDVYTDRLSAEPSDYVTHMSPVDPEARSLTLQAVDQEDEGDEVYKGEEHVPLAFRGDTQLTNVWTKTEARGTHRLSTYAPNSEGRPQIRYKHKLWLVYALALAVAENRDLEEVRERMGDKSATGLTVDHLCRELDPFCSTEDERRCIELKHLFWRTNAGNRKVQWERERRRLQAL